MRLHINIDGATSHCLWLRQILFGLDVDALLQLQSQLDQARHTSHKISVEFCASKKKTLSKTQPHTYTQCHHTLTIANRLIFLFVVFFFKFIFTQCVYFMCNATHVLQYSFIQLVSRGLSPRIVLDLYHSEALPA